MTYKGTPIRLTADFSAEMLQARRKWHDILKVMKGKNLQPRVLHPAKVSFRFDGEIKMRSLLGRVILVVDSSLSPL